jgi:membrane-associated phospholipid phosphatase
VKRRCVLAFAVTALCVAALAATYGVAFATDAGRRADARIFNRIGRGDDSELRRLGRRIGAHKLNIAAAAGVATVAALLAVLSLAGRTRLRVWLVVVLVGAAFATTRLIKPPLGEWGRDLAPARIATDAFPSGHGTLAMAIVLAGVMAMPASRRVAATIVGSVLAVVLGLLIVVGGLHPPSDVIGGYLVAAAWAALLTPFIRQGETAPRSGGPRSFNRDLLTGALALTGLSFAAAVAFYVEDIFGIHRTLLFLVSGLALTSTVIVAVIGSLSDVGERRE